jgi:nucleoside-diphosphate-sugar epimerase
MTPTKILVTGAAGLIGSRLCERLALDYSLPYRALVRNLARAVRIARLGAEIAQGDLARPDTIRAAVAGCDAVVHLAHSDDRMAPHETTNLIAACLEGGVKRLVYISSIAAHGPEPGPECAREETATVRRHYGDPYSDSKARTEARVLRACRRDGLPVVVLRPSIVYGPYSGYVTEPVLAGRRGEVVLIDEGRWVCNAVYIDDVCDAIHAALLRDEAVGEALFVNGDDVVPWREFILMFARLANPEPRVVNVGSAEIRERLRSARPTIRSNGRALVRLAAAPEFHQLIGSVPTLGALLGWTKQQLSRRLSEERKRALKARLRPAGVDPAQSGPELPGIGRLISETCPIRFSNQKAKAVLGWRPRYDLAAGRDLTTHWLRFARLVGGSYQGR